MEKSQGISKFSGIGPVYLVNIKVTRANIILIVITRQIIYSKPPALDDNPECPTVLQVMFGSFGF